MNARRLWGQLSAGLLVAAVWVPSATADVLTFYPTDDAYVDEYDPNRITGGLEWMVVRNTGYGPWECDALARFDVSSIPPGTMITSATYHLYYFQYRDNDPVGRPLTCYRITSDWGEDTVTWNTRPTWASQPTDQTPVPGSYQWMEWDVTSDVQAFVNGTETNFGWCVMDETYWPGGNIPITDFRSKEHGQVIPYLEVVPVGGGPVLVPGVVPDWQQPWFYDPNDPNNLNGGPGPGWGPPWNAWCAPTSAANLCGHWDDTYAYPVADFTPWPTAPPWPSFDWQDFEADPNRPPRGPLPPPGPTDLGWHMDTNQLGTTTWGNPPHVGTFLKDIHAGLRSHLTLPGVDPARGWTTGTQGKAYAAGLDSSGNPAVTHPGPGPAFAEIVGEINAGRTMIVSWLHWSISPTGLPPVDDVEFWEFEYPDPNDLDPWELGQEYNFDYGEEGLGHAVTAVGYLLAGDPKNPRPGTDWVIVHDNVWQTPVNVAVPFNWTWWVANTNAVPRPCPGDIDGDGDTDHSDLGELLAAWCTQEGDPNWNPDADLDGDGHVGHGDLGILLADWGCGTGP